jgi:hypothetical protein
MRPEPIDTTTKDISCAGSHVPIEDAALFLPGYACQPDAVRWATNPLNVTAGLIWQPDIGPIVYATNRSKKRKSHASKSYMATDEHRRTASAEHEHESADTGDRLRKEASRSGSLDRGLDGRAA